MPYSNVISRTDAAALIPEEVSREIVQGVIEESVVLRLGRKLANMARAQTRMPVLSLFPTGYFVNGDTGLKKTTEMNWENKYIDAEEIAVITPIPQAVLDDADYDIWAEIKPQIVAEFGRVFDAAVLFGDNAPASWPDDVLTAAVSASNDVTLGAGADMYEDLCDEGGVIAQVEADGFFHTGAAAAISMRARLRGLRDADGTLLFTRSMQEATNYFLDGSPMIFPRNGCWDVAQAHLILGDWQQLVYSMRQDITYKITDVGVIQDASGAIVYNMFQQDMVALRAVMRLGWQVPNPINRLQETEADRYPFGVLIP
jgi:HK97 family phage major capsid protein